jgi:branched-chain amino acid transport system substrate-binding protein
MSNRSNRKKNKKFLSTLAIFFIAFSLILGITSCKKKEKEEVIKIGAILPLTGNLSFLGVPEATALKIAVNDINLMENKKIEIFIEDSKGQPKDAIAAAKKLIDIQKIQLGLVSTSTIANAVAPFFQKARIPLITFCSDESIAERYPKVVNIYVNLADEQKTLVKYLLSQNILKLSVIRVNAQITERGIQFLKEFSSQKIKIIDEETYELGNPDFKSIVTKIKNSGSEAIYIMGYGPEFPSLVKTIREMGIKKRIFGNYMFLSDGARKEGVQIYKDIEFTAFTISPDEIIKTSFGQEFSKVLGQQPGPFMDYVYIYEAVKILYDMLKAGVNWQEFPEKVRGKTFKTIFGNMKIDYNGNASNPMAIATYTLDGKVKIIWKEN